MSARGILITLEGGEGTGKSTQLAILAEVLQAAGLTVLVLREPGGTPVGEAIREVLLDPRRTNINDRAELLLYEASRAQLVDEVMRPALAAGKVVICDRFYDSTMAYQGHARGLSLDEVRALNRFATAGLTPDLTIVFDIDPTTGLDRATVNGADRLESEEAEFHDRVREGFVRIAEEEPERVVLIDAAGTPAEVAQRVRSALVSLPVLAVALGEHS